MEKRSQPVFFDTSQSHAKESETLPICTFAKNRTRHQDNDAAAPKKPSSGTVSSFSHSFNKYLMCASLLGMCGYKPQPDYIPALKEVTG